MGNQYVQYGCGLAAPEEWKNFDVSPTLRIQKTPIIGQLLKNKLNTVFPPNVAYGDIIKGLPVPQNSVDGLYCSHTLEHLSLNELRKSLVNSYKILKVGGLFRCVVPDMEILARQYLQKLDEGDSQACINFIAETLMGVEERPRGLIAFFKSFYGNRHHLWMWDYHSLSYELEKAGFKNIRRCKFNDSEDEMFKYVESKGRFNNAVAIQCEK